MPSKNVNVTDKMKEGERSIIDKKTRVRKILIREAGIVRGEREELMDDCSRAIYIGKNETFVKIHKPLEGRFVGQHRNDWCSPVIQPFRPYSNSKLYISRPVGGGKEE